MSIKQAVFDGWIQFRNDFDPDADALAWWSLDKTRQGQQPDVEDVARALGWPKARLERALDALEEVGLVTLSPDRSRVTGALGLSLVPADHRLRLDGRDYHTWCALDAVGIPAAFGADALVESRTRDGHPVKIEFRKGKPVRVEGGELEINVPRPDADSCFVNDECLSINFHRRGSGPKNEQVALLDLEEALQLGRIIWKRPGA